MADDRRGRLSLIADAAPPLDSVKTISSPAKVADRAAAALRSGTFHVEQKFITGCAFNAAREAAMALAHSHGRAAGVGEGEVDTSVWKSDALNLLQPNLELPVALAPLLRAIEELRIELARATGRALVGDVELNLLCYHKGGHYVRHFDHVADADDAALVRRSISMLIYLTPSGWKEIDGGCLRIYPPAARPYADVPPTGGSCVLFDSALVPHEAMPTSRERLVIAGWLHEARGER